MNFLSYMFSSIYDQSALVVMAVLLLVNAIVDIVKRRSASPPAPPKG